MASKRHQLKFLGRWTDEGPLDMAGRRLLPDTDTLVRLVEAGHTHAEIAEKYGVSRQAVTLRLKGAAEPRLFRRDWPWDVQTRHRAGWLYERLSFYVEQQKKKRALTAREKERLASMMDAIQAMEKRTGESIIVDYNPETPVGFYFRARTENDPEGILAAAV